MDQAKPLPPRPPFGYPPIPPGPGPECPPGMELAQAYVPWQTFGRTFSPQEALQKGTLFPELYRPYGGVHYR
ncbi:MAG TPA: spore coat associated protein CotJA [Clostridia bacterium]|nr:spore coat associated protein CotJA [Clostridia bacterium]